MAMMVIYLKSMSSFQKSFGRAWRYHQGGSEEGPAVCCSTGTWAGGGRGLGWVLPSLNALTERCFIGQLAQLSAPMPWTPGEAEPWTNQHPRAISSVALKTLPPRRVSMIGLGDILNSGTPKP